MPWCARSNANWTWRKLVYAAKGRSIAVPRWKHGGAGRAVGLPERWRVPISPVVDLVVSDEARSKRGSILADGLYSKGLEVVAGSRGLSSSQPGGGGHGAFGADQASEAQAEARATQEAQAAVPLSA